MQGELFQVYQWVDQFKLSRPKRNISRDFSDAVLLAEIIHQFLPSRVDLHNYPATHNIKQKVSNWSTLDRKVLKKLKCEISVQQQHDLARAAPGAIEILLLKLSKKFHSKKVVSINSQEKDIEKKIAKKPSWVSSPKPVAKKSEPASSYHIDFISTPSTSKLGKVISSCGKNTFKNVNVKKSLHNLSPSPSPNRKRIKLNQTCGQQDYSPSSHRDLPESYAPEYLKKNILLFKELDNKKEFSKLRQQDKKVAEISKIISSIDSSKYCEILPIFNPKNNLNITELEAELRALALYVEAEEKHMKENIKTRSPRGTNKSSKPGQNCNTTQPNEAQRNAKVDNERSAFDRDIKISYYESQYSPRIVNKIKFDSLNLMNSSPKKSSIMLPQRETFARFRTTIHPTIFPPVTLTNLRLNDREEIQPQLDVSTDFDNEECTSINPKPVNGIVSATVKAIVSKICLGEYRISTCNEIDKSKDADILNILMNFDTEIT